MQASTLQKKVGLNIIYMPINSRKKTLVITREDLLDWPEAKAFINTIVKEITTFL